LDRSNRISWTIKSAEGAVEGIGCDVVVLEVRVGPFVINDGVLADSE
jgi:hypothetical protein